jgi:hypothetical protein
MQALSPIRCPACGQMALPHQSHCQYCSARLNEALPAEGAAATAEAPAEKPPTDGKRCPTCGAALAENAVLCVECGYDFRLGMPRLTVVEKVKRPTRDERRRLWVARLPHVVRGLNLYSARILLGMLGTVLLVGLEAIASANRRAWSEETPPWFILAVAVVVAILLTSVTLGLLGSVLCLFVPSESESRGPLALSLVMELAGGALAVVAEVLEWPLHFSWAAGLCSWALFILFLARLAAYIDRPSEEREARAILRFGLGLLGLAVLVVGLSVLAQNAFALGLVAVGLLALSAFMYVGLQFMVLRLLESLRASMRLHVDDARRELERRGSKEPA